MSAPKAPLFSARRPQVRAVAPGRTELAGNHVDHQQGRVLSATVSQCIVIEAAPNGTDTIRMESAGFSPMAVRIGDWAPREGERNASQALIRGLGACFADAGYHPSGLDMRATSTLPAGGGLSSSAAFEMAVAQVFNAFWAQGAVEPLTRARWGKRAECDWFGKPSGLQDQTISACGGILLMDFSDPETPALHPVPFDFGAEGYDVVLVDTHCDHSAFADRFAQIPADMQRVAHLFGAPVLGLVDVDDFLAKLPVVRAKAGDRATLRALHFFRENELVMRRVQALEAHDMATFLRETNASGRSSAQYLQNVSVGGDSQPAMIALALADRVLDGHGAFRIHGGGFGGSVQAYVPQALTKDFCMHLDAWLGAGTCRELSLGAPGAYFEWL
ncbi:MAG: galactokinase [Eggerthellaceae bacterium]|jgi:galactokinase